MYFCKFPLKHASLTNGHLATTHFKKTASGHLTENQRDPSGAYIHMEANTKTVNEVMLRWADWENKVTNPVCMLPLCSS